MERVGGLGGFFFRALDPAALSAWYAGSLGVDAPPPTYEDHSWHQQAGATVFAPFEADTDYFGRDEQTWMLNFRVQDLGAMVTQLREAGTDVELDPEFYPNGRFARLADPEGNPIQLWQPFGRDAGAPPLPAIDLCFRHVDRFNEGVVTGDWEPMLDQFTPDAEVRFKGRPGRPVIGRAAIAAAFTANPPHDQVTVLEMPTLDGAEVGVVFGWRAVRGARTGVMRLRTGLDSDLSSPAIEGFTVVLDRSSTPLF